MLAATTVALQGRGVAISGPSGVGKSELALLLIDRGAVLVSDDQTALRVENGRLIASPAPRIGGRIEIRNLGIFETPSTEAPLALLVALAPDAPRFIEQAEREALLGIALPRITLWPGTPALPVKVEYALRRFGIAL